MKKKLIEKTEHYIKRYLEPPYGREIEGTVELLKEVKDVLSEQPKAGAWIPCSERLPDEGKEVLISYDYDSFDIEMTPKRYLGVMIGYYEDSEWWSSDEWTDGVTAWYPLPEPWKGENDV